MRYDRPIVISVAGFDPSGGAGVLADIKTFEQHHCQGMAVISALTVQTESDFISVEWLSAERIIAQLKPLMEAYDCRYIKFGIIKDPKILGEVIAMIHSMKKNTRIIWDTVLTSSGGFDLMKNIRDEDLIAILKQVYLVTPNTIEAKALGNSGNEHEAAKFLSGFCNVLLKGGHSESAKGTDLLFHHDTTISIKGAEGNYFQKHGSGCILSAAITANLAKGESLENACIKAKSYIEKILNSNEQLLAYHVQ